MLNNKHTPFKFNKGVTIQFIKSDVHLISFSFTKKKLYLLGEFLKLSKYDAQIVSVLLALALKSGNNTVTVKEVSEFIDFFIEFQKNIPKLSPEKRDYYQSIGKIILQFKNRKGN